MIIIRIQGGLGNQLFQYALYESFKSMGKDVKADTTAYRDGREKRQLELEKLGIKLVEAQQEELHYYYADNSIWADRVLRYTIGKSRYIKEKSYDFIPQILELDEGYLNGYWQSEKYFSGVSANIKNYINFQKVNTDMINLRKAQMEEQNSVSVHVRMSDYLQKSKMYGNICTREYYRKAFNYIIERVENPVFYVFSDEPEKAAEMLKEYNCCLITENRNENSYKDMYLMSRCRYHIIANSTFSWWGAWLDKRSNQIVVTPSRWNNICRKNEICCNGWIMV